MPELNHPEWINVHRWRYAFCHQPLPMSCLTTTVPLPFVCAGDWCGCGGVQIEAALTSGKAAADWVQQQSTASRQSKVKSHRRESGFSKSKSKILPH